MFVKHITTGLVATALLSTVAFAQTPMSSSSSAAATSASDTSFQGDWRTSKVIGLNVYNDNNENLGSINELLTDHNGNIKGVVIGVGGVLGVGEHLVAVSFDKIKFVTDPIVYAAGTNAGGNAVTRPTTMSPNAPSTVTTGAAAGTAPGAMAPNSAGTTSSTRANPWYPDHAVLNVTKDELKAMPQFKYTTGSAN